MALISFAEMQEVIASAFLQAGMNEQEARQCALIHAQSTLDGVNSHGVNRVARFVDYIGRGWVNLAGKPKVVKQMGAIEIYDGDRGPGVLNAIFATDRAMEMASQQGVGIVALRNTTHWMRGGAYGWRAADQGYVAISWTNTESCMPAWGARDTRIGNNPFVMAVPRKKGHIVLDMAMSQYSYGRLQTTRLKGRKLPFPGGFDKDGNLTDEPGPIEASMRILPTGYWKGSGFAIMLDVLAAVLGGGMFSSLVAGVLADWIGRRRMMILSGLIFVASVGLIVLSQGFVPLFLGRLLQGISGGFIAVVVPLYLAECLGADVRGRGTAIFQFALTFGIVIAAVTGFYFTRQAEAAILAAAGNATLIRAAQDHAWRSMFLSVVYPGILFFVGSFFLSETPRWLFRQGREADALNALRRSVPEDQAQLQIREMSALAHETTRKNTSGGERLAAAAPLCLPVRACLRHPLVQPDHRHQLGARLPGHHPQAGRHDHPACHPGRCRRQAVELCDDAGWGRLRRSPGAAGSCSGSAPAASSSPRCWARSSSSTSNRSGPTSPRAYRPPSGRTPSASL